MSWTPLIDCHYLADTFAIPDMQTHCNANLRREIQHRAGIGLTRSAHVGHGIERNARDNPALAREEPVSWARRACL